MEDKEYLEQIRKYLWSDMLWKSRNHYSISFDIMYESIHKYIRHAFTGEYWQSLGQSFKEREAEAKRRLAADDIELRELIEELILKMDRKKAKESVNEISAKAILEPLLDDAGLEYFVEYQKSGVKLNILFNSRKKAQLYLSYSKIRRTDHKTLRENILKFKELYEYFGSNSGIVNIIKEEAGCFKRK